MTRVDMHDLITTVMEVSLIHHTLETMKREKELAPLGKEMEIGIVRILNKTMYRVRGQVMNRTETHMVTRMSQRTIIKFLFFSQKESPCGDSF